MHTIVTSDLRAEVEIWLFHACVMHPFTFAISGINPRLYVVVCLSSVTFVRPTQGIEIFGNVSTPFGTLAICELR